MGVVVSKGSTREQRRQSRCIEKILAEEYAKSVKTFKMLLLGTGDSGKSTIVKQMRILHKNGFSKEELIQQRSIVAWNTLQSIAAIVNAMNELGISYDDAELKPAAEDVLKAEKEWLRDGASLTHKDWGRMKKLWTDAGVQACFARSNEYQLSDSTKYFCDDMDRISASDYVPTEQDILRVRVVTTSIVELDFMLRDITLTIIDVGGQRSQRRKWIHCFENVKALIFICAASEYNQVLLEDHHINRMCESLKLFGTVVNSQWFLKSSVVLFMNKKDLFEEKIKVHPLTVAFPDYTGGPSYEATMGFVQTKFEALRRKKIYTHRTCATDTQNIEFVMDACFDMVLQNNVRDLGLELQNYVALSKMRHMTTPTTPYDHHACAASEYNQALLEDHRVKRIHESLKLFGTVISFQWFLKSNIVLFLNKKDLFEEKIKIHLLTTAFPDYTGGPVYETAMDFVQIKFEKLKTDLKKQIYTHRTCATDTKNIEFVMDACFDMVLRNNMRDLGLGMSKAV